MKLTKKITAAVAALTMATSALASTAMSASAAQITGENGTTKYGYFFAFYDHDSDSSTPKQWAPAPYNMDDGNIAGATLNSDGSYKITLQTGNFYGIPVVGNKSGWISEISHTIINEDNEEEEEIVSYGGTTNHPLYADLFATDISNWTTSDYQNSSSGTQYDITAMMTIFGSISIPHTQKDAIFVVTDSPLNTEGWPNT